MDVEAVARAVLEREPPRAMTTRVVAVDGCGGAGKSTFADALAARLRAPVVRTDDFASWSNPVDWWPALLEQVLVPLSRGDPARYRRSAWGGPHDGELVVVEPAPVVVLEGVTASRAAFRSYLTYTVWVETPREERLRRGLERDGESALPDWERWLAAEDAYVRAEEPQAHADLVVRGDR